MNGIIENWSSPNSQVSSVERENYEITNLYSYSYIYFRSISIWSSNHNELTEVTVSWTELTQAN